MRICWLDIRDVGEAGKAILEEAVHQRIDGFVAADPQDLAVLPPTVRKVLFPKDLPAPESLTDVDVLILDAALGADVGPYTSAHPDLEVGRFVDISDADSLDLACRVAREDSWSLLLFRDPTKIPLEIVLAAAAEAGGNIITVVSDVAEAEIVFGVLEHGSEGVMLAPRAVGEATRLKEAASGGGLDLELVELTITATTDLTMGDRVCVDTCSHFREDEGILIGSYSKAMFLCCSETHPLPYMPTRPFRVNAGALHSYTLGANGRTHYLSELRSGSKVLAVDSAGRTREVAVGRVKIENRPMLSIDAVAPSGEKANLIVQHDWHVRVLGPEGVVLNTTELRPGDVVLGYLPKAARHVGYAITEFCVEK